MEWPRGSGRVAEYGPHEDRVLRDLVAACERGEITEAQLGREVGVIHALKVDLDATIRPDPLAEAFVPFEAPPPDSPFQIPLRAAEALAVHDPQLRLG